MERVSCLTCLNALAAQTLDTDSWGNTASCLGVTGGLGVLLDGKPERVVRIEQQRRDLREHAATILSRIPVIGAIARFDQRLNCSVRDSREQRTEQFSR